MILIDDSLVQRISSEEAANLEVITTMEEIKEAVWSYDLLKAPRLDGFNLNFNRKLWDVVGTKFNKVVLDFLT